MKKNILNLTGAKAINKNDQKAINGGFSSPACETPVNGQFCLCKHYYFNGTICVTND